MANVNMTIRIDEEIKNKLDRICEEIGLSSSTAINIFARKMVRDRKFPFEVGISDHAAQVEYPTREELLGVSQQFISDYKKDFEELAK